MDQSDIDKSLVHKMKVPELKFFLRLRGLKVRGNKEDLVCRAVNAIENNLPILKTAEQIEGEIASEYKQKLSVNNVTFPDPFKIENGWKNEEEAITSWPIVSAFAVINFLRVDSTVKDLNDYKSSKAYSYFQQGWLGELFYLQLDAHKEYCLVKADCRPSMRISDTKHNLWLLLSQVNGTVFRAHCTCMAG